MEKLSKISHQHSNREPRCKPYYSISLRCIYLYVYGLYPNIKGHHTQNPDQDLTNAMVKSCPKSA